MKQTAAYFELTNLQGLYANYITTNAFDQVVELFTDDAQLKLPGLDPLRGKKEIRTYFDKVARRGVQEFFSVFGQLTEVRADEEEARCLWVYLSVIFDPDSGTAVHRIGRIDQVCVKVDGVFRIKNHRQLVRVQLEPAQGRYTQLSSTDLARLSLTVQKQFAGCDNDEEIGDILDLINTHSRYDHYLHCGAWDMVDKVFATKEDTSWTVGNRRKQFLAENPDYCKEIDGPGDSEEPPYWMGAVVGHDNIIRDGFASMLPLKPANQGIYCSSDMLLPLVVVNRETGRAYSSAAAWGGFIIGPVFGTQPPYTFLSSISRWHIEWIKENGKWKMYHFFWSTLYEVTAGLYDPKHQNDWISTHEDIHVWPPLPEPYEK